MASETLREYLFRVRFEAEQLFSDTDRVIDQLTRLDTRMRDLGKDFDLSGNVQQVLQQESALERLTAAMEALIGAQERLRQTGRGGVQLTPQEIQAHQGVQDLIGGSEVRRPSASRLEEEIQRVQTAINDILRERKGIEQEIARISQEAALNIYDIATRRQLVEERTRDALTGATAQSFLDREVQSLEDYLGRLREIAAVMETQAIFARGTQAGERLSREVTSERQAIQRARKQELDLNTEIAKLRQNITDQVEAEGVAAIEDKQRLLDLEKQLLEATKLRVQAEETFRRPGGTEEELERALEQTGAAKPLADIQAEIARVEALISDAMTRGVVALSPRLVEIRQELLENASVVQRTNELEEQRLALLQEQAEILRVGVDRRIDTNLDPSQQIIANLPTLERALFSSFDNVGNRFRTAFQFAVSGALLYGIQRFMREFFQAAVAVERTFVDIESALEFDFADEGFERGTVEFEQRLESIRRSVLETANEFNVLPNQANEIAYKMVARFQDIDNAIKATRAQLLAIKISTIDPEESLRALTAVAEGFASQVLETNDALTFQERLLQREGAAADLYAKALDGATKLQQRFGVDVEDSLEGTARAAETFRQLGFSMGETMSIVAATSFQLGQTGSNVAERLNRAFGALTSPEIRNQLLELAASSKAFTLTLQDFESGAKVLEALDRQIRNLERVEPATALRIRDIIGQRRETEVVAAFFGTVDQRQAMREAVESSLGAARDRFSHLQRTISEHIQSIMSQFQSLAQNFERLELFGPVKVALSALEGVLVLLNKALTSIQDFFNWLDRIGQAVDAKIGTGLRNVLVTVISIAAIMRTMSAAFRVFAFARSAPGRVAGALGAAAQGGGPGAAAASVAMTAWMAVANREGRRFGDSLRDSGKIVTAGVNLISKGFDRLSGAIATLIINLTGGRLAQGASAFANVVTGFLGVAVAAGFAIKSLVDLANQGREARDAFREAGHEAFVYAEQQRLLQGLTDLQTKALEAQQKVENIEGARRDNTTGGFGLFLREAFRPPSTESTAEQNRRIQGTKEWWDERFVQAEREFGIAQIAAVREALAAAASRAGPEGAEVAERLSQQLTSVLIRVLAAKTPEEAQAAIQELQKMEVKVNEFGEVANRAFAELQATMQQLQRQLERSNLDFQLGVITPEQHLGQLEQIQKNMRANANALMAEAQRTGDPSLMEEAAAAVVAADQVLLQIIEGRMAAFELELQGASRIRNPIVRLNTEIRILERQLEAIPQWMQYGQRAAQLREQIQQKRAELADQERDNAVKAAEFALLTARGVEELQKAYDALDKALRAAADTPLDRAISSFNTRKSEAQDTARIREIETILAGPIRSRERQIRAAIKALESTLKFLGGTEFAEAMLRLAELRADLVQAQADAAAAAVRSQVGPNDQIASLQAEISITKNQMDIAAKLFGQNSAEWFQLKKTHETLKNQLILAQLELEDVNRRLGSDITNDFEQAQLDLVDIMRRLSQMDLGPLEKARLELEKKQAEARAERAFFDDRLFNLRFDFETGDLGLSGYLDSLRRLLDTVDTSTQQGKEIFLQIQSLIDGLIGDIDMQFNIPDIRLPTLFEVRRAVEADQLGVNYLDNRTQTIEVNLSSEVDGEVWFKLLEDFLGGAVGTEVRRVTAGGAAILPGSF